MQPLGRYQQFAILYVDDEEKSLKSFVRAFAETFRIFTAINAREGLKILEAHRNDIGILFTDQRMPGEHGVWLLERAREMQPQTLRILVTAYTDMDAAIAAVNSGAIYKYVSKPWDPVELQQTLKHGLEFFAVQRERDELLNEKLSVLRNLMIADRLVSLGLLAAGLSHHIRNALVAVKTFLDLAPDKMQEEKAEPARIRNPEFWREYHHNVQNQVQKINTLLQELGAAAEDHRSHFTDEVHLGVVIEEAIQRLRPALAQAKIEVTNSVPASLPVIRVDQLRFCRLFESILKDELASLPAGGRIWFEAEAVADAVGSTGKVQVRIRDNGPSLPNETLRLLFNPFTARSESPAEHGINLMACFFIVHHHGGAIVAESEPAGGTRFTITLPTNPSEAPATQVGPEFLEKVRLNQAHWKELTGL